MNKKAFTLIEIIISLVLISIVGTIFIITYNKKGDKSVSLSSTEKNILYAADVLVNINKDSLSNNYAEQLYLGAQGVQIKLTALVEQGVLEEESLTKLFNELYKKDSTVTLDEVKNYYILVIYGSLEDNEDHCSGGFTYYMSWETELKADSGNSVDLYLCGNSPKESEDKNAFVFIEARNDIYGIYSNAFLVKDIDGKIMDKNEYGEYNLKYGNKYYIEFDFDSDDFYSCWACGYYRLDEFNDDKNYVYLTLSNIISETNESLEDTLYFDLEKYLCVKKPKYNIAKLTDKLGTNARNADAILNYNYVTPYPLSYISSNSPVDSIFIYNFYSYCYSTTYTYNNATQMYKLSGDITCKKYTEADPFFINKYTLKRTYSTGESTDMYYLETETRQSYFSGKHYSNSVNEVDDGYFYDEDISGTTYFFRGNINNNYVSFAGYLWKIIRINGDGTIRIILNDDIGVSNWNGSQSHEAYNGYTYGAINYYPMIGKDTSVTRINIDSTKNYCYSNKIIYDKTIDKYKLDGDIICGKITYESEDYREMYTIFSESKNNYSTKLYKIGWNYDKYKYNVTLYDTGLEEQYYDSSSQYCFGSSYKIENGIYKLDGDIQCNVKINSGGNYNAYINYYTFRANDKSRYWGNLYKYLGRNIYSSNCYIKYETPVAMYTASTANQSKIKTLLEDWYNANLLSYSNYISSSTFCNDTCKTNNYYNSYKRLAFYGAKVTPTFKCECGTNNVFDHGGIYNSKIGLISADEMVFAGATYNSANNNYYLAYNKSFWTMTPYGKDSMFTSSLYENSESYGGGAYYYGYDGDYHDVYTNEEWEECSSGALDCYYYSGSYNAAVNYNIFSNTPLTQSQSSVYSYDGDSGIVVRPVINLMNSTIVYGNGNGTYGNPYVVDTKDDDYIYYSNIMD